MIEIGLLGVAVAGYAGSVYWTSYLRALGQAADYCHQNRLDLALGRLKRALLVPPVGKLVDHWALCLNFQAYLYIQRNQLEWAEKALELIRRRRGVSPAVQSLCFYRQAEIYDKKGLPNEAKASRHQAEERLTAEIEALKSSGIWKPIALLHYGTGYFEQALEGLDRWLQEEWTGALLFLRWLCLEESGASKEQSMTACREALRWEDNPVRRTCLLALASVYEEDPESAIRASDQCLKEQKKLGVKANPELTALALSGRLVALSRLDHEDEYEKTREQFMAALKALRSSDLVYLGGVLIREGRFIEFLSQSERHSDDNVRRHRAVALAQVGRPKDALDSSPDDNWSTAENTADCYLALFQRAQANRAIELLKKREENSYLAWQSRTAFFWDGNPSLARDLWPYDYLDPTRLLYEGRFEECWEAWCESHKSSRSSPRQKDRSRRYFRAVLWLYEEQWIRALDAFETLKTQFSSDPKSRDFSQLYALCCRSWLGQDVADSIAEHTEYMNQHYIQSAMIAADIQVARIQSLLGMKRYQDCLHAVDTTLAREPRAFYRAFLLDLRSLSLRATGRIEPAEQEERAILSLAPESWWARRAGARLQLP